jgi:hypothetical protein
VKHAAVDHVVENGQVIFRQQGIHDEERDRLVAIRRLLLRLADRYGDESR